MRKEHYRERISIIESRKEDQELNEAHRKTIFDTGEHGDNGEPI